MPSELWRQRIYVLQLPERATCPKGSWRWCTFSSLEQFFPRSEQCNRWQFTGSIKACASALVRVSPAMWPCTFFRASFLCKRRSAPESHPPRYGALSMASHFRSAKFCGKLWWMSLGTCFLDFSRKHLPEKWTNNLPPPLQQIHCWKMLATCLLLFLILKNWHVLELLTVDIDLAGPESRSSDESAWLHYVPLNTHTKHLYLRNSFQKYHSVQKISKGT